MPTRHHWVFDIECYRDYALFAFKMIAYGGEEQGVWYREMFPGQPLVPSDFNWILGDVTLVTFNGIHYDFPILSLALAGADNAALKAASDSIIMGGKKHWEIQGGADLSAVDHVDLFEVAPGRAGL